jgi:hypothetical protein
MKQQRATLKAPQETLSVPHQLTRPRRRDGLKAAGGGVTARGGTIGARLSNDAWIEHLYAYDLPT